MLDNSKSQTTVGIYTRSLRVIYNYGIAKGIIKHDENYPFGKNKFIIPAGRNIKKALSLDEIKLIYNYNTIAGSFIDRAKDFWMFSYFCNGINFKDIAHLKRKNIDGEMIRFVREKTKRTAQGNQNKISIYINDNVKSIINKWGNKDVSPEAYIFPIISTSDTAEIQVKKIEQFIQNTNKNMKKICAALGIEKTVTTYHCRHSAATVLKRSGASLEQIQEALGHSTSTITQKYLDSFEDETKKQLAKALLNF
jgi:integrase